MNDKNKKYDVAFFEVFSEEEKALKKYLPKKIHAVYFSKTIQESKLVLPPAGIISIRTQSTIPYLWREKIQAVLTRSQGYDHLVKFLKSRKQKILCGYLGDYCSRAVGEQAIMMTLMLLRKVKRQMGHFDHFNRSGITGYEIKDRKALVVGVGSVGREIVDLARGLKMHVRGVDIVCKMDDLEYVSLSEGIRWADVIFCALPLTPKTEGALNYQRLKANKTKAVLINISRGEITPTRDLKKLLDQGILSAAGLDVYQNESELAHDLRQKRKSSAMTKIIMDLSRRENVIFTPHNAFNTQEASDRKSFLGAQAVECFLTKGHFPNSVLFEYWSFPNQ